jgi:hypothetical protein
MAKEFNRWKKKVLADKFAEISNEIVKVLCSSAVSPTRSKFAKFADVSGSGGPFECGKNGVRVSRTRIGRKQAT